MFQKAFLFIASGLAALVFSLSDPGVWAQDDNKPVVAPQPRTINLTLEQRFIIKENIKDLNLPKAHDSAPATIGDQVPSNIELHPMPPAVAQKVPQVKSHAFFISGRENTIRVFVEYRH